MTNEELFIALSSPFYVVIILTEIIVSNAQKLERYTVKDTAKNIFLMICNSLIDLGFRLVYIPVFVFLYNHRLFTIEYAWIYWIGIILMEDFCYYWLHRTDHVCRLFWAVHVTHHSSEYYNLSTGFRSSTFEPLYRFLFFIPIPLFGFKPEDILLSYAITQIWGILVHTQAVGKLGFLEYIIVTPSHHRVHHASNALYLDKNMGMFLIIWDKLFGTFQKELPKEEYEEIRYGLVHPENLDNPVHLIFHEWKAIGKDVVQKDLTAKQRWNYVWGKPGYSHDGSRMTSSQMRENQKH
jgi:sterol desaturase/sphingolipid hydroxylase (fatty acid hydroxylase superfamily)